MKSGNLIFLIFGVLIGCTKDTLDHLVPGNLTLNFKHLVKGNPAMYNQMIYKNAAGNTYELTNIQWFISDVAFLDTSGNVIPTSAKNWIHYVDTDLPETQSWTIEDIKPGDYKGIIFVFGMKGEKNIPNMFSNPPESNMFWPDMMGGDFGGYHYMKLNGFWLDPAGERTPFNCHLGVGQIYDANDSITGYVQNWFEVFLPNSSFKIAGNETINADLNMNIESWFETPFNFDFNVYGGTIMMNQEAMGKIRDNGNDVFTITYKQVGS